MHGRHVITLSVVILLMWAKPGSHLVAGAVPSGRSPKTQSPSAAVEEFVGPFPSWADVKLRFGAIGDGVSDDTAALQKALDALRPDGPAILWVPRGTYRITQGLTMNLRLAVSILGEDPTTTVIKWDGPPGGVMLFCNGISICRFGRLTWDGSGTALTGIEQNWDGQVSPSDSNNDYVDLIFRDVQFGIHVGRPDFQDDIGFVSRCQFLRCSEAGIAINSFNALDWHIWYSRFENCKIGVTSLRGTFHVQDSVFLNSSEADLEQNGGYCSFRRNYSRGSRRFYYRGFTGNSMPVTIQGNVIVQPQETPVQVNSFGPLLMFDNTIPASPSGWVVSAGSDTDVSSVGNRNPSDPAILGGSRVLRLDDQVQDAGQPLPDEPVLPGFLSRASRPILEVPPNANGAAIQQQIDAAALLNGQRPVVHLPPGLYPVERTLVIPANADLQLVGDGYFYATVLKWIGTNAGPVLRLVGPSRATLRDFGINGNNGRADGVLVDNCDQPGSRVFLERASASGKCSALFVDRLDHANVEFHEFLHGVGYQDIYHEPPPDSQASVRVLGGPLLAGGQPVEARVNIFSGSSGGDGHFYSVDQGGRLMVWDTWFEGPTAQFLRLSGSGAFTLHGANINPYNVVTNPIVDIDNFQGRVTILTAAFNQADLVVHGDGAETKVLALGDGGWPKLDPNSFYTNTSPSARVAVLQARMANPDDRSGHAIPDYRTTGIDDNFLREMLAQTRTNRPSLPSPLSPGLTDARLYRLSLERPRYGIWLVRGDLLVLSQPQSQTVDEFQNAQFSVEVTGTAPAYQWLKNKQPIPDATNAILTIPLASFADNGAQFSVTISNASSSVTSSAATFVVRPESTPPKLLSARVEGDTANRVVVTFSKPVDPATLTQVAAFAIDQGVVISAVAMGPAPDTVVLTTSPIRSSATPVLTVSGVADSGANHNQIVAGSQIPLSFQSAMVTFDPSPYLADWIFAPDYVSSDWLSGPDYIFQQNSWTTSQVNYLVANESRFFVLKSRAAARDMEVDTWMRRGYVYLRLTEEGSALFFHHNGETDRGWLGIGIMVGAGESDYEQGQFYYLYQNNDLLGSVPNYHRYPTDGDHFTFGAEGFDIYVKFNGQEFLRFQDYRHVRSGRAALKGAPGGYGFRATSFSYRTSSKPLRSDPEHRVLNLADFGCRPGKAVGSIEAGSTHLQLLAAPDRPYQKGDYVIVEVGGEAGQGLRGSAGVGGTWPARYYADSVSRDADTSQTVNTFAWIESDGSVRQWNGSQWVDTAAQWNADMGLSGRHYYMSQAVPLALRAAVLDVSADGLLVVLSTPAQVATTNANVYFDNAYVFDKLGRSSGQDGIANYPLSVNGPSFDLTAVTPAGVTLQFPEGEFALGERLVIDGHSGWVLAGANSDRTRLFSPRGVPSAGLVVNGSPGVTIQNLHWVGNARNQGFGLNLPTLFVPVYGVTETSWPREAWSSPGLLFYNHSAGGRAVDLLVEEVFPPAVGSAYSSDGLGASNVQVRLTDGYRADAAPLLSWSDSQGGGCTNCSVVSSELVRGLASIRSAGVQFQNCALTNANLIFEGSGQFFAREVDIVILPNSQGPERWFSERTPLVTVNKNTGVSPIIEDGGRLENIRMIQSGTCNDRHDILRGISITVQNPNVTVVGGLYSTPDYQPPSLLLGPIGLVSDGQNTVADGFRVIGKLNPADQGIHEGNITVGSGAIRNCIADLIKGGPGVVLENNHPNSNVAPVLAAIANVTIPEGVAWSLAVSASDTNYPPQQLSFGLGAGAPQGLQIDSATGVLSWTPAESQGGGNYSVTVTVTDNGTPPLGNSRSFTVRVTESNSAPVLAPIPDISVDERTELNHTVVATDSDLPVQKLTFGLGTNAPTGVTISALGVLHWQPTEAQGPGVYPVTVRVTDNGQPPLSAEQTFTVTVNEVNLAPVLEPIADQKAEASHELQFTATATDSDLPPNVFTFSLDPGAPDGAKIDPATGVFSWTPTIAQAPSTNSVTVRVTDNGTPLLSDTKAFRVAVLGPFVELRIVGAPTVVNGQFTFSWQAQAGRRYRVQFKDSLASVVPWQDTAALITASGATASFREGPNLALPTRFYRVRTE